MGVCWCSRLDALRFFFEQKRWVSPRHFNVDPSEAPIVVWLDGIIKVQYIITTTFLVILCTVLLCFVFVAFVGLVWRLINVSVSM